MYFERALCSLGEETPAARVPLHSRSIHCLIGFDIEERGIRGVVMAALQTELAIDPGTTTELNRYYLQKLEREKYYALALTLFLVIFSFTWLLFRFENGPGQN